jgi:hypothetical protein
LTRNIWKLVQSPIIVFLVALAIRLWTASQLFPDQARAYFYERNEAAHIAAAMATGHGFSSPWPNTPLLPTAQQPPVYPTLLAGIFKVFGVYSYYSLCVAIVVNAGFAAVTAVLIFVIGKRALHPLAGIMAAWYWSCSLLQAAASVRLWESSLSAMLLTATLFLLLDMKDSPKTSKWIIFGLLAGLSALTNTTLLSLFPFFWLWLWDSYRSRGASCRRLLTASVLACALVLSPWVVRNFVVFHRFMPIRDNFGLELWVGNGYDGGFSIDNVTEFNQLGEIQFMEAKRQRALQFIGDHPGQFFRATAYRVFRYWVAPDGSGWPWISLMAWAGMFLSLRRRQNAVPFAIVIIVFPIVYYITHSHVTYRYPIEPVILLLAAYTAVVVFESIERFAMGRHSG